MHRDARFRGRHLYIIVMVIWSCSLIAGHTIQAQEQYSSTPAPSATGWASESARADEDGDGVADDEDNCPFTPRPDQADRDLDDTGDDCEPRPTPMLPSESDESGNSMLAFESVTEFLDEDGDRVIDARDNCAEESNPDQADRDLDGTGDVCDVSPEIVGPANVEDDTYTSPTYGYIVTWPGLWRADATSSEDGHDKLVLENHWGGMESRARAYFVARPDRTPDARECLTEQETVLKNDPAVDETEFRQRRAEQGEDQRDATRAYAVYDFPVEIAGEVFDIGVHLECRVLVPGEAILEIQIFFLPAVHDDPSELVDELMSRFVMPMSPPQVAIWSQEP